MGLADVFSDIYSSLSWTEAHAEAPQEEEEDKEEGGDEGGDEKEEGGDDAEGGDDEGGDGGGDDEEEEEEEEEEDEPVDPKPALEEECAKSAQCAPARHHYDDCVERVTAQESQEAHKGPKEDCVEEFFHLSHCATQCAAPKLFKQLK